jgi:hypothetical protein
MPHYIIETKDGRSALKKDTAGRRSYPSKTIAQNTAARYLARGLAVAVHTFESDGLAEAFLLAKAQKAAKAAAAPTPAKRKTKAVEAVPAVRPPSDRGQGRKALQAGAESLVYPVRMTAAQKEKLHRLGGAQWLRECIERAKEPASA